MATPAGINPYHSIVKSVSATNSEGAAKNSNSMLSAGSTKGKDSIESLSSASAVAFVPEKLDGYGLVGKETARKMCKSLSSHKLNVSYNFSSKTFVILGSSAFKKDQIEKIVSENVYSGWRPSVLDEVDGQGNRLVKFVCVVDEHERNEWTGGDSTF